MFKALSWQVVGAIYCAAISFALTAWLGRVLGGEHFGFFIWLLSVATVVLILIEGGFPALIYRECVNVTHDLARERLKQGVSHVLLVCTFLLCVLSLTGLSGKELSPWVSACLCMGCVAVMNLISAAMRSAGLFREEALWQAFGRTCSAALIVSAVLWLSEGEQVVTVVFIAWAVGLVGTVILRGQSWLVWPRVRGWYSAFQRAWPLMSVWAISLVSFKGDVVFLGFITSDSLSLSWYGANTRFAEAALLLWAPFVNVLLRYFRLYRFEPSAFLNLLFRVLVFALGLGLLAIFISTFIGNWLVLKVFGAEFAGAGLLLPWVLAMLPAGFANLVVMQAAVALELDRPLLVRLGLGVGALLAAIYSGWTIAGLYGVAIGVAVVQLLIFLVITHLVLRQIYREKAAEVITSTG